MAAEEGLTNLQTGDRTAFAGRLNQVHVTVESVEANEVLLRFENNVHQFRRYQLRVGRRGAAGDWQDYDSAIFTWKPHPIARTPKVRAVNTAGAPGSASVVSARFGTPGP